MAVYKILRTHTIVDAYYVEAASEEEAKQNFNPADLEPEDSWESEQADNVEFIKVED